MFLAIQDSARRAMNTRQGFTLNNGTKKGKPGESLIWI